MDLLVPDSWWNHVGVRQFCYRVFYAILACIPELEDVKEMLWEEIQRRQAGITAGEGRPAMNAFSTPPITPPVPAALHVNTLPAPLTAPLSLMQRADEVNTVERMLTDANTSSVMITGVPGCGKSTMAALLYQRARIAQLSGLPAPRHLVWIGIGAYSTLPDLVETILQHIGAPAADFARLPPDQQMATLLHALRRPQESALVVLDEFETLLYGEGYQNNVGEEAMPLFLELLRADLGGSRFLLTCHESPYERQQMAGTETRVRSFLVSRITLPEGVTLLQQHGVYGSPEELALVWQRCSGHVFALALFAALANLSGISLSYLLKAPDYQPMWSGEVVYNLVTAIYHFLNPVQYTLMRTLSLFYEPVPVEGILMTIVGDRLSSGVDTGLFERELQGLMRCSLVQHIVTGNGAPLYTIHPLLRRYALTYYVERPRAPQSRSLATSSISSAVPHSADELQEVLATGHRNAAAYYRYIAGKYYPPGEQRNSMQDVFPLIQAIRHLCLAGDGQNACELFFKEQLHESLNNWGAWYILLSLYKLLLPPATVLLRRDEGLIASLLGLLYGRMGSYQQSQAFFERALSILRQTGDKQGEATILLNQGELLREWGEHKLARQSFEQARALNIQANDPVIACAILHNLGLLYQEDHQHKEAFNCYAQALKLAQDTRAGRYRGMILTSLATLFYEQGVLKETLTLLLAALQLKQSSRDPSTMQLERFLKILENKMGTPAYNQLCQEALRVQDQVLSRIMAADMRQS